MNKTQKIIVVAILLAVIIMPLEGYSLLDVIIPVVILAICFVGFGRKKNSN